MRQWHCQESDGWLPSQGPHGETVSGNEFITCQGMTLWALKFIRNSEFLELRVIPYADKTKKILK